MRFNYYVLCLYRRIKSFKYSVFMYLMKGKIKGKVHPFTGTEALYRPYGP